MTPDASPQPEPEVARPRDPTVHAARHAIEILRCLAQAQPEIGVSEIARRVGLHKSSVSRLIATLEAERIVERNRETDRVALGVGLLAIAAPLLARIGVSQDSRLRMARLAEESGETVNLSVWDGSQGVSVEQTLGTSAITHYASPGTKNPAHCTATGKVLLAFAPADDAARMFAEEPARYTERTVVDRDALRKELNRIRASGVAVNRGEFAADAGAVAAIVQDVHGRPAAALAITVPMYRFNKARERELIDMVRQAAADISGGVGGRL